MEEDAEDEVSDEGVQEPTEDAEEEKGEAPKKKEKPTGLGFQDENTESGGEDELDEMVSFSI